MERERDIKNNEVPKNPLEADEYDKYRGEFVRRLSKESQKDLLRRTLMEVKISKSEAQKLISEDEDIQYYLNHSNEVVKRTGTNIFRGVLDILPFGLGEISETSALAGKISKGSKMFAKGLGKLDTTPDISVQESLAIKAATAPIEMATGGMFPSYLFEAGAQLYKDLNNPKANVGRVKHMLLSFGINPYTLMSVARRNIDNEINMYSHKSKN